MRSSGIQRVMGYGTAGMSARIDGAAGLGAARGGAGRGRRVVISVCAAIPAWVLVGLLVWPDRPWRVDLLSHFVAHFGAALLVLAGVVALSRRTRCAAWGIGAAGLALALWHVWACRPPVGVGGAGGIGAGGGFELKIVQYNAKSVHEDARFEAWLKEQDADLVCLIETPWGFAASRPWVRERYPYRVEPSVQLAWPNLLLSKYPLELLEMEADNPEHMFSFVARRSVTVRLPSGARLAWTAMHPPSPRTRGSWSKSLREASRDAGILARYLAKEDALPMVVTGDFNSAPTGRLHRQFARESGLVGWSPRVGAGTWPSAAGRWLGVPIDRVWTSAGASGGVGGPVVTEMRVGPRFSSDHLAVVACVRVAGVGGKDRLESGISEPSGSDAR